MKTSTPDSDPDRMRAGLRSLESMAHAMWSEISSPDFVFDLPTMRSFVARVETIAHLALLRESVGHAVNLDRPLVDLGILRSALRCYRLEVGPGEERDVDRLIAALDNAQGMLAGETPPELGPATCDAPIRSIGCNGIGSDPKARILCVLPPGHEGPHAESIALASDDLADDFG